MGIPAGMGVDFFGWLKEATERRWSERASFQFPRHTSWRHGLDSAQIRAFESAVGYEFPAELRSMLWAINGTRAPVEQQVLQTAKVAGRAMHFYGFPDDYPAIRNRVVEACEGFGVHPAELARRGIPRIHPIIGRRYLVIDGDSRPVLSLYGRDAIVCGASLRSYLLHELLGEADRDAPLFPQVRFWLDETEHAPGSRRRQRAGSQSG
jgi:hypothetical protein